MNDQIPRETPLSPTAGHMPPVDARQARMTGHLRYILTGSLLLVVVAFAIIYFIYA